MKSKLTPAKTVTKDQSWQLAMPTCSRPKKRPHQQSRLLWAYDDVIQLLAFLDFCLAHRLDFESLVESHLGKVTGKAFSKTKIYAKLTREWTNYGHDESTAVDDLLREGSSVLAAYTVEEHENIQEVASHIEPPQGARYRLRDASSALTSRSRTLSKPRQLSETSSLSIHATPEFAGLESQAEQAGVRGTNAANEDLEVCLATSQSLTMTGALA